MSEINNHQPNMNFVTWADVRNEIKTLNRKLFEIIENIDPGKKLTLIRARYPYGATIVNNGILNLPQSDGVSISIYDPKCDVCMKDALSYSAIPLGLLLNKASEVYVNSVDGRVIPLKLIEPGRFFGLFEVVDNMFGYRSAPVWCVSSGARSVFMLPKISEYNAFNRMKKEFKLAQSPPKNFSEHFAIFKSIASRETVEKKYAWHSEVLFFTDAWFKHNTKNLNWLEFYQYLQQQAWLNSQYARDETAFGSFLLRFSAVLAKRNFRPRPYIMDTVKHLVNIARGSVPGFKPVDDTQIVVPTSVLEDAYMNVYGLKNHLPTIMYPDNFLEKKTGHLYYSLSYPTILESTPKEKNAPTLISDTRDIKTFIDIFTNVVQKNVLNTGHDIVNNMNYGYFHIDSDTYGEINKSDQIPIDDAAFLLNQQKYSESSFCATSHFWRGVIRITSDSNSKH